MTRSDEAPSKRLAEQLETLERSLETPIVPGETEMRAEVVQEAVQAVSTCFRACVADEHPRAFDEIRREDPALLHRVEKMEQEDREVAGAWQRAAEEARALRDTAAAHPGDEHPFRERFGRWAPRALELVLRTRTQEAAVRTWTAEAVQRDRGFGD